MNVIRNKNNACSLDKENNANVPKGVELKHSHVSKDKKQAFNKLTNGAITHGISSCHQNIIDQKPPLLEIPSPDVIQKRLLQLSAAFSRTQLSTLFDFSCLNNGRNNFVGHQYPTYFSSAITTARLSIFSETTVH